MATPVDQLQPPPLAMVQQAYASHSGHGSVGAVIGVLAVITLLGVMAGMIGRLCSGRPIMGRAHYDFEGWVERKCASCIDTRLPSDPSMRWRKRRERRKEGTEEEWLSRRQEERGGHRRRVELAGRLDSILEVIPGFEDL